MQEKNSQQQKGAIDLSEDVFRSRQVRDQVAHILASPMFRSSLRSRKFLEYVVESAVSGRLDQIKERTLGIEVFGREVGYDTGDDAVVRVTAGEVRKRLREYYAGNGNADLVRIDIPSGTYIPEFHFPSANGKAEDQKSSTQPQASRSVGNSRWAKIVLRILVACSLVGTGWIAGRFSLRPRPSLQPYGGTPWSLPGTIQIEDFDIGGQNVAYHTGYNTNFGGVYRTSEGVSIEVNKDTGGGYDVAWTTAGEWLNFTVNVKASGNYVIQTRVSCNCSGGAFHYDVDSVPATPEISVPNTGDWQAWTTVSAPINLSAGKHVIRLVMDTAGSTGAVANFNWFSVDRLAK